MTGELQLFIIALIFIISALWLGKRSSVKLNEPPLVPYTLPILGHTISYYMDVTNFLAKCRQQHGEIFSLYLWGSVQTFVAKGPFFSEVYKNHDFSFNAAMEDILPMCSFLHRPDGFFNIVAKYAKEYMRDLDRYAERVQKNLIISLDEIIGDGKVIKSPISVIQQIIARPIAATIVGELCDDPELVNSFANMTSDMVPLLSIPPILNFILPGLHKKFLVFKFKYSNSPIKKHRRIIHKRITPVIKKRIIDKNNLGDSWERPNDILQELIEKFMIDENTTDIECVTDFVINFIFASVHTTSYSFVQCLYDYVNNPEYHKELLEEAKMIHSEYKHLPYYTTEVLGKMKKLDNFMRESLRYNTNTTSMFRKSTSGFTFSNGYEIPKGRFVQSITQQIHFDPKTYGPDPREFNPYRHSNIVSTSPGRDYVAFGTGKEVCPGRFFAVNEIKVAMHLMQLRYNIRSVSGKHVDQVLFAGFVLPSDEGFVFEKRNDSII